MSSSPDPVNRMHGGHFPHDSPPCAFSLGNRNITLLEVYLYQYKYMFISIYIQSSGIHICLPILTVPIGSAVNTDYQPGSGSGKIRTGFGALCLTGDV